MCGNFLFLFLRSFFRLQKVSNLFLIFVKPFFVGKTGYLKVGKMKKLHVLFFVSAFIAINLCLTLFVNAQINGKFKKSKDAIPNRFIVVLNKDRNVFSEAVPSPLQTDRVQRMSRDLTTAYGGRVDRTFSFAIQAFSIEMTPEQALRLSQDTRVKYVEEDFIVRKNETQTNPPLGLDRIDQRNLPLNQTYTYTTTGAGVHVYVMDSGIRATHTEFTGRLGNGTDAVNDGQNGNDCDGHGTHVAGTIAGTKYGVAKNATLHNVRVLGCDGSSTGSSILTGMDWVSANRIQPAVVNMSLGGGYSSTFNTVIGNAVNQGITYVVSAGNDNNDACDKSPASAPEAITVGSTTVADNRSSFSNYGVCVDIFAPGSQILSSWNTSDTATQFLQGTSMAAPHVTGVIARFLETNPTASPTLIANSVINSATNGVISDAGPGSPNRLLFANVTVDNTTPSAPVPGPTPAVRINDKSPATPYPSEYVVSGFNGVIDNTNAFSFAVNIKGFSHTTTGDVAFVLEGPTGARILLQSQVGANEEANKLDYTFRDTGTTMSSTNAIANSTYKPTAYKVVNFPSPGPGTSYNNPGPVNGGTATLISTYGKTNPNGIWKLYVLDENSGDRGRIDSWSLTMAPLPFPSPVSNYNGMVVSDTRIDLTWSASPPNQDIVSYSIRYNQGPWITGITGTSYSLTGLEPGTLSN